jgi:hypothetical protein
MAFKKIGATRKRAKSHAKRKPTRSRSRRRVSGIGKIDIGGIAMKAAGLGAGAIAARELNTIGAKSLPSVFGNPMISGFIQIAAGVLLPIFVKGNKFVADMGDGMIANGIMVEAVTLGVISGVGDDSPTRQYKINGFTGSGSTGLRVIAGTGNLKTIAAVPRTRVKARQGERLY